MSIDDVLSRSRLREDRMWEPFSHCFLGAYDSGRRTILFGLYANSFENGFAYLVEISTEKLVQLVAEYDLNMAQLLLDHDLEHLVVHAVRPGDHRHAHGHADRHRERGDQRAPLVPPQVAPGQGETEGQT